VDTPGVEADEAVGSAVAPAGHSAEEADEDTLENGEPAEVGMRSQGRRKLVVGMQDAWVGTRVARQEEEQTEGEVGSSWTVELGETREAARESQFVLRPPNDFAVLPWVLWRLVSPSRYPEGCA
jgi:hypothetical protein